MNKSKSLVLDISQGLWSICPVGLWQQINFYVYLVYTLITIYETTESQLNIDIVYLLGLTIMVSKSLIASNLF